MPRTRLTVPATSPLTKVTLDGLKLSRLAVMALSNSPADARGRDEQAADGDASR